MADTPTGEKPNEPAATTVAPATAAPVETTAPATAAPAAAAKPTETAPAAAAVTTEKPAETKAAEKPAEVKPAETETKPEVYDLKGKGGQPVDPGLMATMLPVLKEAGITPKAAQSLVDTFNAYQTKLLPEIMNRDLETLRKDPELGLLNFGRTQNRINDALAAFSTPDERKVLTEMGIANNPTLVRMFHRIGTAMQEPPQTDAGPQPRSPRSTGNKLYGGSDLVSSKPS
jgi:hypothetical protein